MTDERFEFTSDWTTKNVANWETLFAGIAGRPGVRFLEVGSYDGRSACWWLSNVLTDPTAELVCVDPWHRNPTRERRFDRNIVATGCSDRVRKIKTRGDQLMPKLAAGAFDAIYIDGSHEGHDVLLDALLAWRVLKVGGVLLFDDYLWTGDPHHNPQHTPRPAIDTFLTLNDYRLEVLLHDYQVAVRKTA